MDKIWVRVNLMHFRLITLSTETLLIRLILSELSEYLQRKSAFLSYLKETKNNYILVIN